MTEEEHKILEEIGVCSFVNKIPYYRKEIEKMTEEEIREYLLTLGKVRANREEWADMVLKFIDPLNELLSKEGDMSDKYLVLEAISLETIECQKRIVEHFKKKNLSIEKDKIQ